MLEALKCEEPVSEGVKTGMCVSRLTLSYFRNYQQLRLDVGSAPVVLAGDNGAGKTNILEAISLLSPGRGFRRARLSDMDHRGGQMHDDAPATNPWAIAAQLATPLGETHVGTGRDAEAGDIDRRIVRIDGKTVRGQGDLSRVFSTAWMVPQMDQLFTDGGSARRKFLDRIVYNFDAEHASRVQAYEQLMRERNRVLALPGRRDDAWLTALERDMAERALAIAVARLAAIERVNHAMGMSTHSFPKARVEIKGFIEDRLLAGDPAIEIEHALMHGWCELRGADAASGRTSEGPHRSQLTVFHELKGSEAEFCSTGEQKALLLSIILAEARAAKWWHGAAPVLLLDEVVAHLDQRRRVELYDEICDIGAQAWMTGTDAAFFSAFNGRAQMFHVSHARVEEL